MKPFFFEEWAARYKWVAVLLVILASNAFSYAKGYRHDEALRTECKQAISITEELITELEGWMQFAHSTEHEAD